MTTLDADLPPEVLEIFREEARENLSAIAEGLRTLEAGTAADAAKVRAGVARRLHTVKGAAASLGFEAVSKVAHAAETTLATSHADPAQLARVVQAVAWLEEASREGGGDPARVLAALGVAPGKPAVVEGPRPSAPRASAPQAGGEDLVRLRLRAIDALLSPLSVLASERTEARYRGERLRRLGEDARALARRAARGAHAPEDLEALEGLAAQLEREAKSARDSSRSSARAVASLEELVQRMRLVAFSSVEEALRLAVRDAAIRTGKDAVLTVEGGGVLVDRRILDELRAPLLHLVRNAVDHGLEANELRRKQGKPLPGRVSLRVVSLGEVVELAVSDDGAGVDLVRVADRAVRLGLKTREEASRLAPADTLAMLALPGFSTRETVTEVSGRGVGLDVVDRSVRGLGGAVAMASEPGAGSRFTLTVPVSVLSTRVLFVRADEQVLALPLSGVEATGRLTAADQFEVGGRACATLGGVTAVVRRLGAARPGGLEGATPAVRVQTSEGPLALLVDEILGEEEVAVRPLGPPVRRVRGVIGSTVAESGSVVVVVNPRELQELGQATHAPRAEVRRTGQRVLVVDDSITTRTLERHILERAGFSVGLASDGVEALAALRAQPYEVVVSDMEMPNLDGVGLVRAMRGDAKLERVPVILVTSLAAEADRRRALAAGAQAYIVKSQFDQDALLAAVREQLEAAGHG